MKPRDLISRQTQIAFREMFVGQYVLREISDFFDGAGVQLGESDPNAPIGGQRRTLVEDYYSTVDWTTPSSVHPVTEVFEAVLIDLGARADDPFNPNKYAKTEVEKLTRLLRRDGYIWDGCRLRPEYEQAIVFEATEHARHFNGTVLREHLGRIEGNVEADPALAIGAAKELVEAVSKMVLDHYGEFTDKKRETFPQLVGRAMDCLDLKADRIPDSNKAADAARKVLGSLVGVTHGMAEIRNRYGTGHGRPTPSSIKPRHAMLMVGAAATLARFMMATYEDRLRTEQTKTVA